MLEMILYTEVVLHYLENRACLPSSGSPRRVAAVARHRYKEHRQVEYWSRGDKLAGKCKYIINTK